MTEKNRVHKRLPRNFHKTFIPERQYICAMLRYAASNQAGNYQDISVTTGIPTGISSGKVPAILDYSRGMGLLRLYGEERSSLKKPELTPFGRIVLLEDPYLKERVTQWIAHLNLCGPLTGADVWYYTFMSGAQTLGQNFSRHMLEDHLALVYKTQRGSLIGPLIRMYEEDAAFRACGALSESSGNNISRNPAPVADEFGFAYGAWILQIMLDNFPKANQVTVTELDSKAGWRTIPGWDTDYLQRALELIERKGVLKVDRHMNPWILSPAAALEETWGRIYDDLI